MSRASARLALLVAIGLAGCGSQPSSSPDAPLPKLTSITVAAAGDDGGQGWDGVVEAVQHADLAAQTSGRVTAVEVDVNDTVSAGQVLLRLTAVEQQAGATAARAQLRAAEAMAAEAEANYGRYQALGSKQFVSRLQLDQARAARDAAVANRDAARAQLAQAGQQADYTVVRAPFEGIVTGRHVEPGESLSAGQPLLSLDAPGARRIEVKVPQSQAHAIRATARARIELADGRVLVAAQVIVFPAADPVTHSVPVRVLLPAASDSPQPGTIAKVTFPIPGGTGLISIPRSAVVQRGELSGAYVIDGGRLSLRQLRLGRGRGEQVEVISGLAAGEVIAADPVAATQAIAGQRKAAGGVDD